MATISKPVALLVAVAALLALANDTQAQRRRRGAAPSGWSAAGLLGYGALLDDDDGWDDVNAYSLGLGGRVGYTLAPVPMYFGGRLAFHVGETEEYALGTVERSGWSMLLGGEVGYDISAGPVIVRPYLGLGLANFFWSVEPCAGDCDDSDSGLYFAPGGAVLVPVGGLFLGGDLSFLVATDGPDALALFFTLGSYFGS